jgi:hypothetical protein
MPAVCRPSISWITMRVARCDSCPTMRARSPCAWPSFCSSIWSFLKRSRLANCIDPPIGTSQHHTLTMNRLVPSQRRNGRQCPPGCGTHLLTVHPQPILLAPHLLSTLHHHPPDPLRTLLPSTNIAQAQQARTRLSASPPQPCSHSPSCRRLHHWQMALPCPHQITLPLTASSIPRAPRRRRQHFFLASGKRTLDDTVAHFLLRRCYRLTFWLCSSDISHLASF